ncbi:MAG: AmmeMemoRadiSam system protein A [Ignavibacteriales bacterium]|nr:AmmeMemoRadiSam system protein A [Ignavibacteriales bacterium]
MEISSTEKEILLKAARNAITSLFIKTEIPKPDFKEHPILQLKAGAFVTLMEYDELRGCIGYIISDDKLFDTVCKAAISAAKRDPRFFPLQETELEQVEIEISVLSPPFKMESYGEIIVGTHGLILEDLGKRGLLLPQVPIEHKMNKNEYLTAICHKAGLPGNSWKTKQLNMKLFTATVFSEKEMGVKNGNG